MTTRSVSAATLLLLAVLAAGHETPGAAPPGAPAPAWPTAGATAPASTGQFFFPRLQFSCIENAPDKWDAWPIGDQKLRAAVRATTNVNILTDPVVVNLDHPDQLMQFPFVFMTSEAHFKLSDQASRTLREYLLRGGFLMADDCVYEQTRSHFYAAFATEMKRIFPDQVVREVPQDHDIFSCFHRLDHVPWVQGEVHPAMGVFEKASGRLMAICTSGDLHCGWVGFQNLDQQSCKECIQMGVNTIVYCLTH